jgi:hypothetical protein
VALLLAACELETRAVLDVQRDGSGSAGVELHLDEALVNELDELGIDPAAELAAVTAADPDWRLEREARDGGLALRAVREDTDDPAAALAELSAGLTEEDPGLFLDLALEADDEGRIEVQGSARLQGPTAPGAVDDAGEPLGPDAAQLRELTATHVTGELEVTLPGRVVGHDANQADGSTMRWSLPPGTDVPVGAVSVPQAVPTGVLVLGGGALVLAAVATGVAFALRRR